METSLRPGVSEARSDQLELGRVLHECRFALQTTKAEYGMKFQ
jgi:hypothetical protein